METFIKNDVEVLLFLDPVDEFWLPNISEYKKCKFKSVTKGNINLKNIKKDSKKDEKNTNTLDKLIAYMKNYYGKKVKDVKTSNRLTNSPVCFVADENEMDIHLENLLKKHKHLDKVTTKVLEINPDHEIIKYLAKLDFTKDKKKKITSDIYIYI